MMKRARDSKFSKLCYQHVVQVVVDFGGVPLFVSGPHFGTVVDIKLWRRYGPDLEGDCVFG